MVEQRCQLFECKSGKAGTVEVIYREIDELFITSYPTLVCKDCAKRFVTRSGFLKGTSPPLHARPFEPYEGMKTKKEWMEEDPTVCKHWSRNLRCYYAARSEGIFADGGAYCGWRFCGWTSKTSGKHFMKLR